MGGYLLRMFAVAQALAVARIAARSLRRGAKLMPILLALAGVGHETGFGRWGGGGPALGALPPDVARETFAKRRESAEQTVMLLREGRYEEATARFDPALKQVLPAAKLKELWQSLTAASGDFDGCRVQRYERIGAAWLLRAHCRWRKLKLILRFAFDRQQGICGLWIDSEERHAPEGLPKGGYRFGKVIEEAARADLSLEVKILGHDGKPVERGGVAFWMAVDAAADEEEECWHDPATGKIWRHAGVTSSWYTHKLEKLVPGTYRAMAWAWPGHSSALGLGEPITLDGKQKHAVAAVRLMAGSTLVLRVVDAATGKAAPSPDVVIVTCKSGHLPPRWQAVPTTRGPTMTIEHLPPATYAVTARLPASRPDALEYTLKGGPVEVEIAAGQAKKEVTLPMHAAKLTEEEIAKRWPWSVVGRVTDAQGRPVPGAVVRAHCGMGTLHQTGTTESGKDGRYTLRFSSGVFTFGVMPGEPPVNLQAATISVSKPGMVEKNLHRQGNLTMANRPPPPEFPRWGPARGLVLPGQPFPLDFVLVPAISLEGELLDAESKPIAEKPLWISGKHLPPSSSVLQSGQTDAQGHFRFEAIAPGYGWWFGLRRSGTGHVVRSLPLIFSKAQPYHVRLRLRKDAESGLDLLEVVSVTDAKGKEVAGEVVNDDPWMRPPLPPHLQAQGMEILAKVFAANRYWLDRPPPEVRTYRYDFRFGTEEAKTYDVPQTGDVPASVRRGISFVSVLHGLKAHPERAVLRQLEVKPDRIVLTYSLREGASVSAGNGVLGPWRGYFQRSVQSGTLVIDPKTYTLQEHRSRYHQETFSDYVEIRPGQFAPLRVQVSDGGMEFDFRFRVYEPGLWLFASSRREGPGGKPEVVAQVEKVAVNGQPGKVIHQKP